MAIWRGVGGSGESTNDSTVPTVTALLVDAEAARDAAQLAETNAETAASNAASSASTASTQASNAATSATNAASSASSASTSATNAASSASTASTQASNAASSASAASTSATNAASSASSAASSASTATTKASEASTSATNAASSATAAASSASTATTQASNAASSASAAATSASNAATSESNAASSASAAAASYDSFDDRYLGAKSSAPTLDNDGNALLTGALYFNTSTNEMKVWSGSAWLNAYASLSGALLATNNLSDLNNVATARTNLGLGTAATQNSTAFATAAQGTNADTAYGWGNHALAGYAADSAVVKLTGDQTIAGTKTFSSTISGSISGNAGTVTNGVYTVGDQTIAGTKTFSSNPILSAGTANGVVYLNGSKVATSGSALVFDGTNLGIGTTSPSGKLHVEGGTENAIIGSSTRKLYFRADGGGVMLGTGAGQTGNSIYFNETSNFLYFQTASTERARIDSSGNFGIGTSSPGAKLQVAGGESRFTNTSNAGVAAYYESSSSAGEIAAYNWGGSAWLPLSLNGGSLLFKIQSTERARIDSSGNFGIGTSSPTSRLDIASGNITISNSTNAPFINFVDNTTRSQSLARITMDQVSGTAGQLLFSTTTGGTLSERARIDSSGNFLVGKTSAAGSGVGFQAQPDGYVRTIMSASTNTTTSWDLYSSGAGLYRFYVGMGGTIYATNTTISAISDQRFKENIQDLDVGLSQIMALKPRKFDWKAGKGKDIKGDRGFIAQEFEQVFPDLIDEWKDPAPKGEEPYKSVRADLIPVLVKAIQEQQAIIEQLKADVASLKGA